MQLWKRSVNSRNVAAFRVSIATVFMSQASGWQLWILTSMDHPANQIPTL